jgi:hypothetical protein
MSSSEAYLGSFESPDQVKATVDKQTVESFLSSMEMKDITITQEQWYKIWQAIYKSDLVSDFFGGVIEIATTVIEGE